MSDNRQQLIDRLKRIHALAQQGATEGERTAAASLLGTLLNRHGLTIDDLSEQKLERVAIRTRNDTGLIVACMVYRHAFDVTANHIPVWDSKAAGYHVFEVPAARAAEFEEEATRHVRQFFKYVESQMRTLAEAYVAKNDLYPASQEPTIVDPKSMSDADIMAWAMREAAIKAAPALPAAKSRQITGK